MNDELPPTPLPWTADDDFNSMTETPSVAAVLSALLKHPGRVIYEIAFGRAGLVLGILAVVASVSLSVYGVVVGSLSGAEQYWAAPVKILFGSAAAAAICLPSLFVFLCMNGANAYLRQVVGLLLASVCLMAVLLVSFSPIAWVFSQSTDSVPLMTTLHLLLWMVAIGFGLRLLSRSVKLVWNSAGGLGLWMCIYVVVCLQMITAVRPIIGREADFLPKGKQFFLAHWVRVMGGEATSR